MKEYQRERERKCEKETGRELMTERVCCACVVERETAAYKQTERVRERGMKVSSSMR